MSMCECAACHRRFSGLTTFDRHQDWDYKRQPMLICRDPADLGMRINHHDYWASAEKRPDLPSGKKSADRTEAGA